MESCSDVGESSKIGETKRALQNVRRKKSAKRGVQPGRRRGGIGCAKADQFFRKIAEYGEGERMNVRRVVLVVFWEVLLLAAVRAGLARPAGYEASAVAAADAQILSEIHNHSQAMENLEYLSDEIGPRLTGSPQLKQANDWTAAKFREYGLTGVKLEPWSIARSWTRGAAHASIVSPTVHPLTLAAAGWSPGTNGIVRGPLVYVDAKTKEDLEKFRGKL